MVSYRLSLCAIVLAVACHSPPTPAPMRVKLIQDHGITLSPDVLVVVDGAPWPHDSLTRLDPDRVAEVRIVRDTVALRQLNAPGYRAAVLIATKRDVRQKDSTSLPHN